MEKYKPYQQKETPVLDVGFALSLLRDAFGFTSPIYLPYGLKQDFVARGYQLPSDTEAEQINGYQVSIIEDMEADRLSQFGTPVLGSFTTEGGIYKVYDKVSGRLVEKEYPDFEFPVATIVDFERPKNITKTPTIGSAGTVKEIFGFDDWQINIRGICLQDVSRVAQKKAKEQQGMLIFLNEIAGSINLLKGKLFFEKYISRLTIEKLSISALQAKPGIVQFEITALSDEDVLLIDV
jgi:hypothetical protein